MASENKVRSVIRDLKKKVHFVKESQIFKQYLERNPMPALSDQDKEIIDAYWKQFGIKISNYNSFQWYYAVTGIKDPSFIPQDIYKFIIWPYHDNEEFCLAWKDKNLFERFVPGIPFPRNYIRRIHGRFFDGNGNFLPDENVVISTLQNLHLGG